jgi:hypothetical protein
VGCVSAMLGPIAGFAVFMFVVLALLAVVAVICSRRALRRNATLDASVLASGLHPGEFGADYYRRQRAGQVDLNRLRDIIGQRTTSGEHASR